MSSMLKIVRFHRSGGPEVLQLEDLPAPVPQAGEVRIKVDAIGLNRAEVMFRRGQYLEQPEFPSLLGYEASGTVEELGPGVTGLKPWGPSQFDPGILDAKIWDLRRGSGSPSPRIGQIPGEPQPNRGDCNLDAIPDRVWSH